MKFIKKNINLVVAIAVFILVVVGLIVLKNFLAPSENKAIYGNRLEGRKKVKITDDKLKEVNNSSIDKAESIKTRISGRIIEITVMVHGDASLDDAKNVGNSLLEKFSDEEKKYYDIQIFIDKKESAQFPIIGYKHHAKDALVWTKDRAES